MLLQLILLYGIWGKNIVQAATAGFRNNAVMRIERLNYTLRSTVIQTYMKSSQLGCMHACVLRETCKSINFEMTGGTCELLPITMAATSNSFEYKRGWAYLEFVCQDHSRTFATFCSKSDCPSGYTCDLTCAGRGYACKEMPLTTTKEPTTTAKPSTTTKPTTKAKPTTTAKPTTGKTDGDKK